MIDGHPLEYDHFWKPIGETLGLYLFYFILLWWNLCRATCPRATRCCRSNDEDNTHARKKLCPQKSWSAMLPVYLPSASSRCGMMDWLCSVTDVRRLRDGKAGAAAAQDCVNIHYTLSDGEAGDSSNTWTLRAPCEELFLFKKRFMPTAPTHCSLGWILNGTALWFNPQTCLTKQGQGIILIL